MNNNDRFLLISIENPKLHITLTIGFSSLGVTGEEIPETRWGRVEEIRVPERGGSPSAVFPGLLTFAAVFLGVTQRWGELWVPFRSSFHLPFPPFPKNCLILRLVGNRVLVKLVIPCWH